MDPRDVLADEWLVDVTSLLWSCTLQVEPLPSSKMAHQFLQEVQQLNSVTDCDDFSHRWSVMDPGATYRTRKEGVVRGARGRTRRVTEWRMGESMTSYDDIRGIAEHHVEMK